MFYRTIKIVLLIIILSTHFALYHHCVAKDDDIILERIDFVNASAIDVVRALVEQGGLNIVVGSAASGTVGKKITIHMRNISCVDAIDQVLRIAGFRYERQGDTILISTLPQDVSSSAYEKKEKVLKLKHIFGNDATGVLSKVLPQLSLTSGPQSKILILRGDPGDVSQAESIIREIDKPTPQILIEGKVVEVSESGMEEFGIKWGREVGSFKFAIDKKTGEFGLTEDILLILNKLATEGKAEILAEPSIVTLDGEEASINIGSRIPYAVPANTSSGTIQWAVSYIDAGVSLKIIPRVSEDGFVSVLFRPEVSSISEWRTTSAGEFPVITTRNAESQVRVKDGETIVIAGLINKSERENLSKILFLGDIPLFGLLFQSRVKESAKTEIVFLITPKII